ncbi:hypothetical protein T484DRAFT_1786698 [Baffinella frigidus]|nr:hypothetical protein T484DRAFT_1786698 [Cryptophyta sp. CCMP2293]
MQQNGAARAAGAAGGGDSEDDFGDFEEYKSGGPTPIPFTPPSPSVTRVPAAYTSEPGADGPALGQISRLRADGPASGQAPEVKHAPPPPAAPVVDSDPFADLLAEDGMASGDGGDAGGDDWLGEEKPVLEKGAIVWYKDREGTFVEAKVLSLDRALQPPSYFIAVGDAERETERHRARD